MLTSLSFKNYYSFADKAKLSFSLTERDTAEGWVRRSPSGERLTTAMAVMGPNAAGKSNLIKVGQFLAWFISDSFSIAPGEDMRFYPHAARSDEPSEFEVVYEDSKGTKWTYSLIAFQSKVMFESLTRRPNENGAKSSSIFTRRLLSEDKYEVAQNLGLADSEAAKVRPNVSLISWARQYGSEVALRVGNTSVMSNLDEWGRNTRSEIFDAAKYFNENKQHSSHANQLLADWDFGLSEVRYEKIEARHIPEPATRWLPFGVHKHEGSEFLLPLFMESSGTQSAFVLLSRLLPVLSSGGIALVDELESDLHPHIIEPLLRLFHDEKTNPKFAQIIFTCHSPEILNFLHRAQVTFVQKTDCVSEAYRGDSIRGLTDQHNLYKKYLSGALGAIPQV